MGHFVVIDLLCGTSMDVFGLTSFPTFFRLPFPTSLPVPPHSPLFPFGPQVLLGTLDLSLDSRFVSLLPLNMAFSFYANFRT